MLCVGRGARRRLGARNGTGVIGDLWAGRQRCFRLCSLLRGRCTSGNHLSLLTRNRIGPGDNLRRDPVISFPPRLLIFATFLLADGNFCSAGAGVLPDRRVIVREDAGGRRPSILGNGATCDVRRAVCSLRWGERGNGPAIAFGLGRRRGQPVQRRRGYQLFDRIGTDDLDRKPKPGVFFGEIPAENARKCREPENQSEDQRSVQKPRKSGPTQHAHTPRLSRIRRDEGRLPGTPDRTPVSPVS